MIINKDNKAVVAKNVIYATNLWQRLIGLMGRKKLGIDSALVIYPCQQIHTFFMKFPIDCIFFNESFEVIKVYESIKPWRMSRKVPKAYGVIELPKGTVKRALIKERDKLHFIRG